MSLNAKEEMWVRKQVMAEERRTAEQSALIEALATPTDSNLVHQGAEAAARAKMFMRGVSSDLEAYYSVLEQRLTALAMKMERG